ncbi:MAG: RNA polymerase sigma factor [Gammaproteobacteria bacterium]|nr:RNA polymerase sigma factor [Gammaproteobacteria bacterium]
MSQAARETTADEAGLVARARNGDTAAFEGLYRAHAGRVYGLCLRMMRRRDVAEDLTQEVFVSAWRSLPGFEGRSGFGTWLHRIAVNAALARDRSPRGRDEVSLTDEEGEQMEIGAEEAMDAATPIDLERAIATLPPGARDVMVLYGIYGYSHEEAAEMLGVAVGTCKAQLHRARHLLRERMQVEGHA